MDWRLIKKGLLNPGESVRYLTRRVKDYRSDHYRWDHSNVSGASDFPEFASEIYCDATLALDVLDGESVARSLEVGCGYGKMTPWFADYAEDHVAIDAEPKLIESARKTNPGVTFHEALAQDLPFEDNEFDRSITWGVLMHVPPADIQAAIDELTRVTKPDGTVIVCEKMHGTGPARTFVRSATEYQQLIASWEVQESKDRTMEPWRDDDHGNTALVFSKEADADT